MSSIYGLLIMQIGGFFALALAAYFLVRRHSRAAAGALCAGIIVAGVIFAGFSTLVLIADHHQEGVNVASDVGTSSPDAETVVSTPDAGASTHRVTLHVPPRLLGEDRSPLLVWLHGTGGGPEELEAQLGPIAEQLGFVFFGISATRPTAGGRFEWTEEFERDRDHVKAAIDELSTQQRKDFAPIVVLGFGDGAQVATNLALSEPWVDGALVFSPGWRGPPQDLLPLLNVRRDRKRAVVVVGEREAPATLSAAREDAAALTEAGFEVTIRVTDEQSRHALPEDFVASFPRWWSIAAGP